MTELEKLQARKRKLNEFWDSLTNDEKTTANGTGGFTANTPLADVILEEAHRIDNAMAKIRLEEYLNIDQTFEKEVLK